MFRDLEVGEVLGWDVGEMARDITVHAFVREPFDQYVHDNSRFWNASGAKVGLGPNGLQLQLESLRALVLGGIAFETPDDPKVTAESDTDHAFKLYQSQDAADSAEFKRSVPFVANFTGSVAGLTAGASVTLHGLKVGEVTSVSLVYDPTLDNVIVPVHFMLEPDRISALDLPTGGQLDTKMAELVQSRAACEARFRQYPDRVEATGDGPVSRRRTRRTQQGRRGLRHPGAGRQFRRYRHVGHQPGQPAERRSVRVDRPESQRVFGGGECAGE